MPVIINACYNAEGSTYELAAASRHDIEHRFPGRLRTHQRVFVAGAGRDTHHLADREFVRPLLALLTGLPVEVVAELLPVEFRDPVFDEPL